MIPIIVTWRHYTTTVNGRIHKLVPCENCKTEYVYVLEREGTGMGTSVYFLNEGGAQQRAQLGAQESLQSYLENDFDPIPCPVCGHYQRYMFPKLYDDGSTWVPLARLVAIVTCCMAAVGAVYWTVAYLRWFSDHALVRLAVTWSLFAVLLLIIFAIRAVERSQARRFDPNTEDQQARIAKGRSRAVTRTEFEAYQRNRDVGTPDRPTGHKE